MMKFVLSPSNHLIGIGPKLDGNTLHIRASSWEWTAIFCLNWRTCSTGSVRPLYMANVGWWKRLGSFAFFIPRVKGDLEIWLKAFFITLVPTPLRDGLLRFFFLWICSSSQKKRLTRWSSWSLFVDSIFFIIRKNIRAGRGLFPLCSTKLPV